MISSEGSAPRSKVVETGSGGRGFFQAVLTGRPLRFLLSGGLATLVHWSLMAALILVGMSALAATAVGASVGAITNYGLQYRVTFRSTQAHRVAFPRYLLTALVSLIANQLVFTVLQSGLGVSVALAQLFTTVAVALLNYGLCKRLVFS